VDAARGAQRQTYDTRKVRSGERARECIHRTRELWGQLSSGDNSYCCNKVALRHPRGAPTAPRRLYALVTAPTRPAFSVSAMPTYVYIYICVHHTGAYASRKDQERLTTVVNISFYSDGVSSERDGRYCRHCGPTR